MIDILTFVLVVILVMERAETRKRVEDLGYKLGKLWKKL